MHPVITDLRLEEPARFNPDCLETLCTRIGETRAEAEVARALDRIATALAGLPPSTPGHLAEVPEATLTSLRADAELIGMATLAKVARDVLACRTAGDPVSLGATLARLRRVGDRSIHAVWDLDDVSV